MMIRRLALLLLLALLATPSRADCRTEYSDSYASDWGLSRTDWEASCRNGEQPSDILRRRQAAAMASCAARFQGKVKEGKVQSFEVSVACARGRTGEASLASRLGVPSTEVGNGVGSIRGRIAFSSSRGGTGSDSGLLYHEVYVLSAPAGDVRRLTSFAALRPAEYSPKIYVADWGPQWSPDGRRIAFLSTGDQLPNKIYLMNADGTGMKAIVSMDGVIVHVCWSPDGKMLAYGAANTYHGSATEDLSQHLYLVDARSRKIRRLTVKDARDPGATYTEESSPNFSPDGRRIVFVRDTVQATDAQLWVVDADGSNSRRLTARVTGVKDSGPSWSPDGSLIAFVSNRDGVDGLYIVGADGNGVRRLTTFRSNRPSWSPDGRWIAFNGGLQDRGTANDAGKSSLFAITPDASKLLQLTDGSFRDQDPSWSR